MPSRPPRAAAASSGAVDAAIFEALREPFLLRVMYRRRRQDAPAERVVAPHGLLLGVRRYLVARDASKTAGARLRHYRVGEIHGAEMLEDSFDVDPGFYVRNHA